MDSLTPIARDLFDALPASRPDFGTQWSGGQRRYPRRSSYSISEEMYYLAQKIIHDPKFPFNGEMNALIRHALAGLFFALDGLDPETRFMVKVLGDNERWLVHEETVLTIDKQIDRHTEVLGRWTETAQWGAAAKSLEEAIKGLDTYPDPRWRRYAAGRWLVHKKLKMLVTAWEQRMQQEDEESWRNVKVVFEHLNQMAGQ